MQIFVIRINLSEMYLKTQNHEKSDNYSCARSYNSRSPNWIFTILDHVFLL